MLRADEMVSHFAVEYVMLRLVQVEKSFAPYDEALLV